MRTFVKPETKSKKRSVSKVTNREPTNWDILCALSEISEMLKKLEHDIQVYCVR